MKLSVALLSLCTALALAGCAQKAVETQLATKISTEEPVANSQELQGDASLLIENSRLNSAQKVEFKKLQAETAKKLSIMRDQSLKLRSILIKDVFSPKYNRSEVRLIQDKIEKVEKARVAVIFSTIDKANEIFGRETDAEENRRLMDRMMMDRDYR